MKKFEDSFWRSFLSGVTAATIVSVSFTAGWIAAEGLDPRPFREWLEGFSATD